MGVTRKGARRTPRYRGIVAVASTQDEAISQYQRLRDNQLGAVYQDSEGNMVALASTKSFSPLTGESTLTKTGKRVKPKMASTSSAGTEVEINYTICTEGCGAHLISSSNLNPSHCPSCSSAISDLSEDELKAYAEASVLGEPSGNEGLVITASSLEEAENRLREVIESESMGIEVSDAGDDFVSESGVSQAPITFTSHSACAINYSPFSGDEVTSTKPKGFASTSSAKALTASELVEIDYLQCTAGCEEGHVLSTASAMPFCPSCSAVLVDPQDLQELRSLSSEGDEFEDDDDDYDELDIALGEDEDDDEDEDEQLLSESGYATVTFTSESSAHDDDDGGFASVSMADDDDDEDEDFDLDEDDDIDEDDLDDDDLDEDDDDEDGDFDDYSFELDEDDDDDLDLDDDDLMSESSFTKSPVDLSLLTALSHSNGELNPSLVALAHCGDLGKGAMWTAFYDGLPVATANVNDVEEKLRGIFHGDTYKQAVLASVRENGVQKGLTSLGFKEVNPELDLEVVAEASVIEQADKAVTQMKAECDARVSDLANRFEAALASTSQALARGVLRDKSHPIKDSLIASLSASGIGNAEHLVEQAFVAHSDDWAKILVSKSSALVKGSVEAQNEFTELVSNFTSVSSVKSGAADIGHHKPAETTAPTSAVSQQGQLQSESSSNADDETLQAALNSLY